MKHCPNAECESIAKYGVVAEYVDSVPRCVHCDVELEPGPAPDPTRPGVGWQTLVPVAAFSEVHRAYAAMAVLRAAGIGAEVRDDHYAGLSWHHGLALGGVRVLVPESELGAAREVLEDTDPSVVEEAAARSAPLDQRCPQCGSQRVGRVADRRVNRIVTWLLLGIPALFARIRWRCADCGAEYVP